MKIETASCNKKEWGGIERKIEFLNNPERFIRSVKVETMILFNKLKGYISGQEEKRVLLGYCLDLAVKERVAGMSDSEVSYLREKMAEVKKGRKEEVVWVGTIERVLKACEETRKANVLVITRDKSL